jgi:cytochrome c oxidase subunit II
MRRTTATGLFVVAMGLGGATLGGALLAQTETNNAKQEQVIKIVARRFAYTPNEIVLKKGQPVVLEFTSIDFVHGFKIPDLNIRADLPPGKVTRIRLTPDKVGVYDFLCDNFCGSEHEDMSGRILVKD